MNNNILEDKKKEIFLTKIINMVDIKNMLSLLLKQIKEESKLESRIDIAMTMKEIGHKIKDISDITGLPIKKIKVL